MQRSFIGFLALALVGLAGCSQDKPGTAGGPGAQDPNAKKSVSGQVDDTFNLTLPAASTALRQGDAKETSIAIKRAKNFDQDVTLQFTNVPKGVSFYPPSPVIKQGEADAKITLKVEDNAAPGDFTVKVTGHPAKGADATNELKLTVAKIATFNLSVPASGTTLKQGGRQEVSIGIKRDESFDYDVMLTFAEMPKGVTLIPANPVIKHGDAETKVMLTSTADAPLGDFGIKVTGQPTKGPAATNEFKLTVVKTAAAVDKEVNIVDTAIAAGNFKTLTNALKQAGLTETLQGKGPFTVFAPTDAAFAKLPKDKLDALLNDKAKLSAVLQYHVVAGRVMAADVAKMDSAKTSQGTAVAIASRNGEVTINNAMVTQADVAASNGVIHVIDTVLMPKE